MARPRRAGSTPGARRYADRVGRPQTGRQELRLAANGAGTGEAYQAGTVIPNFQEVAAQARDLATPL